MLIISDKKRFGCIQRSLQYPQHETTEKERIFGHGMVPLIPLSHGIVRAQIRCVKGKE